MTHYFSAGYAFIAKSALWILGAAAALLTVVLLALAIGLVVEMVKIGKRVKARVQIWIRRQAKAGKG